MRTKKCVAISIYTLTREVVFTISMDNEIKREFCVVINCLILTRTDLHKGSLLYFESQSSHSSAVCGYLSC